MGSEKHVQSLAAPPAFHLRSSPPSESVQPNNPISQSVADGSLPSSQGQGGEGLSRFQRADRERRGEERSNSPSSGSECPGQSPGKVLVVQSAQGSLDQLEDVFPEGKREGCGRNG